MDTMTFPPPPPRPTTTPPGKALGQLAAIAVVAIAGVLFGAFAVSATTEPVAPADLSSCLDALAAADAAFGVTGQQLAGILDLIDGHDTPASSSDTMDRLQRDLQRDLADYTTARNQCRRTTT